MSVSVGMPHHLEGERDVEQPDASGRVEGVNTRLHGRALGEQRSPRAGA